MLPQGKERLRKMGEQIRLARLRRNLSVKLVAERAGVSRASVWSVEKGNSTVAIGMQDELLKIAADDPLGKSLEENRLLDKYRRKKVTL